jgi:putative transposase
MVERPEEYEYSSYRMYIGVKKEKVISSERVLSYFKEERNRKLYKVFVENSIKLQAKEETVG